MFNKLIKNKRGYSLLEIVVSLAIIAVMMVMLTNIMVISLTVSAKTSARANTREEISNILANMKRDIRNAELIKNCTGVDDGAVCEGILAVSGAFSWGICAEEDGTKMVCKRDRDGNITESTPSHINIDKLSFDVGFDKTLDKRTIIVTIVASNESERLNVKNVIQQTSISTRNYSGQN